MGTNFYVEADPTCNNREHTERLHIGKRSGGWKFLFHSIPERGLASWKAWQEFLANRKILGDDGAVMSLVTFAEMVESLQDEPNCLIERNERRSTPSWNMRNEYHDLEGFDFTEGNFS